MIRIAIKVANESKFRRARVGAIVAKGERILSSGYNHIGNNSVVYGRPYPESVHAEVAAITKLLREQRLEDLVGATIYVTRIDRGGRVRMAKPCNYCMELIKSVGIRKVVYTTN